MQKGIIVSDQKWIVSKYGDEQFLIHMEECAELIQAISKFQRYKTSKAREQVIEEMAEDCVKREDAKKFLYERLDRLNDDELYDIFSRIIDDMYNELPSVQPQPKSEDMREVQK